ncbi:MAG: uroporphyrinogen-III synthase, partial [Symploca sp. SIO2G7]|nr:uroporphyrinogen-III synthase [Symploca sp. SIO2G7]
FERLLTQGKDARVLAGVKIAVVGKKTASSLKQYSLQPDFIPLNFVADSLVEHFPEPLAGKKILFPRVETGGRQVLIEELTAQRAEIVEVAAYESGCPAQILPGVLEALQQRDVDVLTFASSKTVKNFYQLLVEALTCNLEPTPPLLTELSKENILPQPIQLQPVYLENPRSLLDGVCIASIGPQTSKTCHQLLGRVDVEAQEYTLEGLTAAIEQWIKDRN